jgi:thiol-disulfide isomerase/thioredoxin
MRKLLLFLVVASLLQVACDKIDQPYNISYEFDLSLFPGAPELYPYPNFGSFPYTEKRVLAEDYTGHTCGNCPGAAVVLDELVNKYPGKVVPIAMHSSQGAEAKSSYQAIRTSGEKYTREFRTPEGNKYGNFFEVQGNPLGMMDRTKGSLNRYTIPKANFEARIIEQLAKPLEVNIQVEINYYEETRGVFAHVQAKPVEAHDKNLAVSVYLIEDTIVDWQLNYAPDNGDPSYPVGDIEFYVHKHTFVGTINGTWGQDLGDEFKEEDAEVIFDYSFPIDTKHHGEMQVVAFIYDKDTYEVLQVANNYFHVD